MSWLLIPKLLPTQEVLNMKTKLLVSTTLLLGCLTLSQAVNTTKAFGQSAQKPYCTSASDDGVSWMRWGSSSIEKACFEVFTKLLNAGKSVDRAAWGYYKSGQNTGQLSCIQGNRKVTGSGGGIFENAMNMRQSLGWSGCIVKL
jgi:predicted small secreted protein